MENLNIAITGGGTGGHLKIAKIIKEELKKRELNPIYIGSSFGAEIDWFFKDEGFKKDIFCHRMELLIKRIK
nr:glycosyltransferase [Lebetimonas sp. JH292]